MTTLKDTLRDYVYEVIINNRLDPEMQADTATLRENYVHEASIKLARGLSGIVAGLTEQIGSVDKESIVLDDVLEEWIEEFKERIIG